MIAIPIRRTVFPLSIALIGALVAGCSPAKNIIVGEELSTNSDQWVAKTKGGGAMRRTQFGNFNMVSYEKIDSPSLVWRSATFFSFHLLERDKVVKKRKIYNLTVADGKDSTNILVFIWQTKTDSESGIFTLDIFKQDGSLAGILHAGRHESNARRYKYKLFNCRAPVNH